MSIERALRHPLLSECGVGHGFGLRGVEPPPGLLRPRQVHGALVAEVDGIAGLDLAEADAVVSTLPGRPVGIVTADCVPILAASRSGRAVAAIHAGWKGLASGVIEAGIGVLRSRSRGEPVVAVVGPHIGPAHYEVDEPVMDALRPRFGAELDAALEPTRPGHARLDLGRLALRALEAAGIPELAAARLPGTCTFSDPRRFDSFRRDGQEAGRMVHHIEPRATSLDRGGSQT